MLIQKRLREVLRYDPDTGTFTWIRGERKGQVAGTVHNVRGSLKVAIDGQRYQLHHLAWLWMNGRLPRFSVDHVDGDPSNNRWANLRQGDRFQRATHRGHWPEATGIPGVSKMGDKFDAMIATDSVILNLGLFETADAAQKAIADAMRKGREQQRRRQQSAA
jgi:hypothetical protein